MSLRRGLCVVVALLLACAWGERAFAGPPFVTDDPETTDPKHWEIDFGGIYSHTAGSDFGLAPMLEVDYGLVEDVQLHAIFSVANSRDPDGGSAHTGYGDTELGVKYRFVHETDTLPQIGVFPLIEVPTGDPRRGLGNGKVQVFIPIWAQKSFGKKVGEEGDDKEWKTMFGGGFWYNPAGRNYFLFGWELERYINEHLTLGAEVYHATPNDVDTQGHTAFNVGGYFHFDDHNHVLFSAGRDIDGPNTFSSYLAYQLTF
jgi:hypothetical protein